MRHLDKELISFVAGAHLDEECEHDLKVLEHVHTEECDEGCELGLAIDLAV